MPVSKESREQLGRALAEAREEAGLTVVQLAQIASPGRAGGLSRYYDAEAGRRMATSETVSHYAKALRRPDLQDLRNKILSKRPSPMTAYGQHDADGVDSADDEGVTAATRPPPNRSPSSESAGRDRPPSIGNLSDAIPKPELLPQSLSGPMSDFVKAQETLDDGAVIRGRDAILGAACALMEEAIERSEAGGSVSVQVIQMNPERTFTRNLGSAIEHASRFFPFQIQRLIMAGGSVRHLIAYEIMHTLDMWAAFERFIGLMELAGDYSVYWPSRHQSKARMPDYLIVEGVAALEIYPTGPLTWAGDAAILHREPSPALHVVKDYGENLIAEADEAFQVTDPSSTYAVEQARVWVEQAILEAEQLGATRFLYKYGLSTLTEPLKAYERRLLLTHDLSPDDRASWPPWVKQDLELRRRRLANFLKQIEHHRSIDVVPFSALRHFVDHGRYSENCSEFREYVVPVADRIRHLEDVITMISTNVRYDMVIIEDEPPLAGLIGAGLLMMGTPDRSEDDWLIFYQSEKPSASGQHISVAFETRLDMFRDRVGSRIAVLEERADQGATQHALRLLHQLIDELRARAEGSTV